MMEWERIKNLEDRVSELEEMVKSLIELMETQANINENIYSIVGTRVFNTDSVSDDLNGTIID